MAGQNTQITVIAAPSNLGLRPLREGHEPGTWQAPEALLRAGLEEALGFPKLVRLSRPAYSPEAQPGTRLLNGHAIRAYSLMLADTVAGVLAQGRRPIVIGGDCSLVLGALVAARRAGPVSLVHIDGHSDFRHPGNYDPSRSLGTVAGMDLALATGRGEALLTDWPGVEGPLLADRDIVQLGERECLDADYAWPDINETEIHRITIFDALQTTTDAVIDRIDQVLNSKAGQSFWLHLDVDVLDQRVMPAVDSPGSPGLAPGELARILRHLVGKDTYLGVTVTVFDPDLDPDGKYAGLIVSLLANLAPP